MFCTNCGSKLPEGARFCSICGVRVAETEPEEKVAVTPLDLNFSEVKPAEAPMKTRVTFDWSNVIDEPHRKKTETIKSPWETSGSVEEKDVLSEMTPSTDRSRTMSFIDVLKAEKEQQVAKPVEEKPVEEPISKLEEMIAEDAEQSQGFDYTEVLDPGYLNNSIEEKEEAVETEFVEPEIPELHVAPLYEDVDEPVKSPFDEDASTEPVFEEPEFEEPVVDAEEEPTEDFAEKTEEPNEESKDAWFEMPGFLKQKEDEDRVAFEEAPVIEAHEVEIPAVEKNVGDFSPETDEVVEAVTLADDSAIAEVDVPTLDATEVEEAPAVEPEVPVEESVDALVDEYDDYMNIDTEQRVGRGHRSQKYEEEFDDGDDEEDAQPELEPETYDEVTEYEEEDFDSASTEEEIFSAAELTKHSGMTIAAPADRESEIEALKARLAELMGESVESPAEEPVEDIVEEEPTTEEVPITEEVEVPAVEEVEEPVAEEVEAPAVEEVEEPSTTTEPTIDDILAAVLKEAAVPASETVGAVPAVDLVPEVEVPSLEELINEPVAETQSTNAVDEEVSEEPAPVEEHTADSLEAAEVPVEPVVEESVAEESAVVEKETDAVSLEDLEKDLFGTAPENETEAEVTKKIDKFYTLYRKNEEFQRLLDEEYNKLKAAGGTAPEPVLPDLEPQKPVEDATIYQPLDKPLEELAKEEAAKADAVKTEVKAETKPVVKAEESADNSGLKDAAIPVAAVAGTAATALASEVKGQGPEVEYEEVDKGGTFLTVLAVVIALLLVVLLAILLVLHLAPTSGAAIWIDSIIENISSHFSAVDGSVTEYLL